MYIGVFGVNARWECVLKNWKRTCTLDLDLLHGALIKLDELGAKLEQLLMTIDGCVF